MLQAKCAYDYTCTCLVMHADVDIWMYIGSTMIMRMIMRVSVAYDSEVRGVIIGKLSDGLQQWYTCMQMHMRILISDCHTCTASQ